MKVSVLGAGLVGRAIAIDLAKDNEFEVTAADINENNLGFISELNIKTECKDLGNPDSVKTIVQDADIVVNALPGFLGFRSLKYVIESGKNVVDIAFYAEDPFLLDELAKKHGVTAIVDCGVAPGLSNMIIGNCNAKFDKTESAVIYVGGLPVHRDGLFDYKCVFSISDVLEEYTRPARLVENGEVVVRPALSERELIYFSGPGEELEAFNSDGLRTLINTIPAVNMKEKTLRYPGHVEKMELLRETGFFNKDIIPSVSKEISPYDFTWRLLANSLKLGDGESDMTVMRVEVKGHSNCRPIKRTFDLTDFYDKNSNIHSMARTTGYTATMAVRMLAKSMFTRKGISPPEYCGSDDACFNFIITGLKQRGISIIEY